MVVQVLSLPFCGQRLIRESQTEGYALLHDYNEVKRCIMNINKMVGLKNH